MKKLKSIFSFIILSVVFANANDPPGQPKLSLSAYGSLANITSGDMNTLIGLLNKRNNGVLNGYPELYNFIDPIGGVGEYGLGCMYHFNRFFCLGVGMGKLGWTRDLPYYRLQSEFWGVDLYRTDCRATMLLRSYCVSMRLYSKPIKRIRPYFTSQIGQCMGDLQVLISGSYNVNRSQSDTNQDMIAIKAEAENITWHLGIGVEVSIVSRASFYVECKYKTCTLDHWLSTGNANNKIWFQVYEGHYVKEHYGLLSENAICDKDCIQSKEFVFDASGLYFSAGLRVCLF